MAASRATPFAFGNMGNCLIEKVERNEPCPVCEKPFVVGEEIWEYECNHIVHCTCRPYDRTDWCPLKHMLDGRYTIRTLVQRGSHLPKKLRGRKLTEALQAKRSAWERFMRGKKKLSILDALKNPKIALAHVDRLLGVGTSTAAPLLDANAPRMSEKRCQLCKAQLRADRAIYRHKSCSHVFCFLCIEQNPAVCPACRMPFRNEVERIDCDI